MGFGGLK